MPQPIILTRHAIVLNRHPIRFQTTSSAILALFVLFLDTLIAVPLRQTMVLPLRSRDRIGVGFRIGNETIAHVAIAPIRLPTLEEKMSVAVFPLYGVTRALQNKRGNPVDFLVQRVRDRPDTSDQCESPSQSRSHDSLSATYLMEERVSEERNFLLRCFDKSELRFDEQVLREEVLALRTIPFHPNLINVRDIFETPSTLFLVVDQVSLGSLGLSKAMKPGRLEFLSPRRVQRLSALFMQMCAAVAHVHGHGMSCHLRSSVGTFVLSNEDLDGDDAADYTMRLSRSLFDNSDVLCTSIEYPPVSRFKDVLLAQSEDVLALGILLLEMLHGPLTTNSSNPAVDEVNPHSVFQSLCSSNNALSPGLIRFFEELIISHPDHRDSALRLGAWVEENLYREVACRSSPSYSLSKSSPVDVRRTQEVYAGIHDKLVAIIGHHVESVVSYRPMYGCTTSIQKMVVNMEHGVLDDILNTWHNDEVYFLAELLGSDIRTLRLGNNLSMKIKRVIRKLYTHVGALPSVLFLRGTVLTHPDYVSDGGFGNIYVGDYDGQKVAVKRPRVRTTDYLAVFKNAWLREIFVMFFTNDSRHPNILPFIGLDTSIWAGDELPSILTPWMENGTIMNYLETRLARTTYQDVRRLMYGLTSGLAFLHAQGVVHGDLCGRNILIDDDGVPLLADFGLSWFMNVTEVRHDQGSYAWQAPELLGVLSGAVVHPDGPERTLESDIYALGCSFFEMCTGQPPFYDSSSFGTLLLRLRRGDRPRREPVFPVTFWKPIPDWLWEIIARCWSQHPSARPSALSIAEELEVLILDD